jgi:hypothetical protein
MNNMVYFLAVPALGSILSARKVCIFEILKIDTF